MFIATSSNGSPAATLLIVATLLACRPGTATAQTARPADSEPRQPTDYRSKNFLIHTDLPKDKADDLLDRLETMLGIISRYWGAPNRRIIECYVVDNLKNWPRGSLNPQVMAYLSAGGGITISHGIRRGRQFQMKATVYAIAQRGTPQHEAVHAYCHQTFGEAGPTWYAEGMAEMGHYWIEGDPTVNCPQYMANYLRRSPRKTIREITAPKQKTGDSWQNYAWRWALCHLLANNTNYSDRFRPMGVGLLTKKNTSFQRTYGSKLEELEFEYRFFLEHLERGYEVGRCSWDWKARFRPLKPDRPVSIRIASDRGWQPARVALKAGEVCIIEARGTWQTGPDASPVTARGDSRGHGALVGTIMADRQLSDPFPIPADKQFESPSEGNLYLRCRDDWASLADNSGSLQVQIRANAEAADAP